VKELEVTKDMRRQAKVINFGIAYGMGVTALKENLGSTRKEAQEFYDNYFAKFPAIKDYFNTVKADAARLGYTETFYGRRRHFDNLKSHIPYIRAMAERMAMNAPIQGTAADIIKIAMKKADTAIRSAGFADTAHVLLQIHDELIYEVDEKVVETLIPFIREAMQDFPELSIPLTVHIAQGATLGRLEELD
jgi:DNA polymerase-1